MEAIYAVVASVGVLLWVPILRTFFRQWRQRGNPVSLAICGMIVLVMWWAIAGAWLIAGQVDAVFVVFGTALGSILTAACVHLAFYRSKIRFRDERERREAPWRSAP